MPSSSSKWRMTPNKQNNQQFRLPSLRMTEFILRKNEKNRKTLRDNFDSSKWIWKFVFSLFFRKLTWRIHHGIVIVSLCHLSWLFWLARAFLLALVTWRYDVQHIQFLLLVSPYYLWLFLQFIFCCSLSLSLSRHCFGSWYYLHSEFFSFFRFQIPFWLLKEWEGDGEEESSSTLLIIQQQRHSFVRHKFKYCMDLVRRHIVALLVLLCCCGHVSTKLMIRANTLNRFSVSLILNHIWMHALCASRIPFRQPSYTQGQHSY